MNFPKLLKMISNGKTLISGRIPGQIVVQFTNACNAKCPQCGMNTGNNFKRTRLPVEDVKRLIDHAASRNVKAISFTGGEPFLYVDEVVTLIQYAGQAGIDFIRTGTNGYLMMGPEREDFSRRVAQIAEKLRGTKLRNFWISIDSAVPEVHEQMRGLPGVIKGIEKALPVFHEHGIYPSANMAINRNTGGPDTRVAKLDPNNPGAFYAKYREAFRRFFKLVINLGFTMVNMCYPMSVDSDSEGEVKAVYGATSPDDVVRFTAEEKRWIFQALFDTLPEFRSKIRIFTPLSSVYSMIRTYDGEKEYSYACRGGIDFFFVDAVNGDAYPCGYRGNESLGKVWEIDFHEIDKRAYCRLCDWECFKDPSELLGPVLALFNRPLNLAQRFYRDRQYAKVWLEDLLYYRACNYFDGRMPPRYGQLKKRAAHTL